MRNVNFSVPEVVREIITRNRSIYDCMKMDLINYTALAVKIQPEVEKIIGNAINLNTIVVAIKRYADSFEVKEEIRDESILKDARLSLTDGIVDVKLSTNEFEMENLMTIMDKFSKINPDYEFFRSADSFRILTDDLVNLREIIGSFPIEENTFNTGLAKIKIRVPNLEKRSDIVSFVAEILHDNGIELVNAYFSQSDIIVVLNAKDAPRAYEKLRAEISR